MTTRTIPERRMEFAGYILWGFICFVASICLFTFVFVARFSRLPLFIGYLAVLLLAFTSLFAFDGCYVAWSNARSSQRQASHIFTADTLPEQVLRLRYPTMVAAVLSALAVLHLGPRRRIVPLPPPLTPHEF